MKPAEFLGGLRPASRVPFQAVCQHIVDRPSTEDQACRFYATSLLEISLILQYLSCDTFNP